MSADEKAPPDTSSISTEPQGSEEEDVKDDEIDSATESDAGDISSNDVDELDESKAPQTINFNVLLARTVPKAVNSREALEAAQEVLEFAKDFEKHQITQEGERIQLIERRAEAIIKLKNIDPDEIEKRLDRQVQRRLKQASAIAVLLAVIGLIMGVLIGAPILPVALLATLVGIGMPLLFVLASGAGLSASDAAHLAERIIRAFRENHDDKAQDPHMKRKPRPPAKQRSTKEKGRS